MGAGGGGGWCVLSATSQSLLADTTYPITIGTGGADGQSAAGGGTKAAGCLMEFLL